jgi:serine/threonine protein kinase
MIRLGHETRIPDLQSRLGNAADRSFSTSNCGNVRGNTRFSENIGDTDGLPLGRKVAIKILPPDKVADAARKKRFLQEARAASALNHRNIVTLHDIADDSGVDYLVMELVPGESLDKMITSKGLP